MDRTPEEAYSPLCGGTNPPLILFRDASYGVPFYEISLINCLYALHKALQYGFFDFNDFDSAEYEYYEVSMQKALNAKIAYFIINILFI